MRVSVPVICILQNIFIAFSFNDYEYELRIFGHIIHMQEWKEVAVLPCRQHGLFRQTIWRNTFGDFVFVNIITEKKKIKDLLRPNIKASFLPVLVIQPCQYSLALLKEASEQRMMNKHFSWWIFFNLSMENFDIKIDSSHSLTEELKNIFGPLQAYADSNINVVTVEKNHTNIILWDVFKLSSNQSIHARKLVQWNSLPLKHITHFSYKTKILLRSKSLKNTILRVGVLLEKSDYNCDCELYVEENSNEIHLLGGYSIEIIKILIKHLHIKAHTIGRNKWGTLNDGQWTGLIGLLTEDLADLVICHPTVNAARSSAVHFLHSTLHTKRVLVYKASGLPVTQDVFVLTFRKSLWLCFIFILALLPVCLYFCMHFESKLTENIQAWGGMQVALWIVAATCQQGCTEQPHGASCSVVFIVGYLTMYLLYTAFAAGVTSLLAIQGKDIHVQLTDVNRMKADFAVYWDGLIPEMFQKSSDPAIISLYSTSLLKEHNRIHNLKMLFEHINGEKSVAMATQYPIKYYMATKLQNEDACQITLAAVPGTDHYKAFAMAKNSPFIDIFNYWLLRMQEAGLFKSAEKRNFPPCQCISGPKYSSASLIHVTSAIVIFGIGIALAIVFLFFEKAWYYHKKENYWREVTRQEILHHWSKNRKYK